ncbi:UNKNOWN [Stylonychia lemnae]|uniref:PATROL1-like C-terminal domain-containing protein n=1 Tax=Stylonychia lemnae TaxID=5949 RepID=A0A078AV70_STYLE|nr:UNKNOWN [Stylonychia lemnae]|eukprot:CDW85886.1 UNKNOWN [Stylonychia lemnae]
MRDAINSLINFTIQESELHKEFALQTKTNIVEVLDETRKNLSLNKKNWMAKLEQLKRQIRESNEVYKREYLKYQQQNLVVEDCKRKRNEQYLKYGLNIDDQIAFENMPKPIQLAEQRYNEALAKFNDIKKSTQIQQEYTERCVSDFNKGSSDILEQIEKQEYQRLDVLKQNLQSFSVQIVSLLQQHESLHKLIDLEFSNVDPMKDIQLFIQKNSTFAKNERLKNLYKEMGLYQQINEEQSTQTIDKNKLHVGEGLLVEKTSRAMAQRLKQMEEDRKRKAIEDENSKKEQLKLKKCQNVVNIMKDTRELLYKIGNQALKYQSIDNLYQARPGVTGEFKIGNKNTIEQLSYLLLLVYKPISTNNLQPKFNITEEIASYLDPIIKNLSSNKQSDLFQILHRIFEHYRQLETNSGGKYFENQISSKEKEFYKSLMGFSWTWIRLIVLKHSAYNVEQYEKELSSFIDQVELEHHQSSQCTLEAIDFTFNAMKYVQKISKKDSFNLCFPLNYLLHQNIIPLYMDDGKNKNSKLGISFQDYYLNLQGFTEKILGNKALYSLKYLIQKLTKEHPSSVSHRIISVELIKDKQIEEPLNYFSSSNKEPAKLLSIINNCWLMSDLCKDLFKILENYDNNFGECFNKLRLILDFASICFRQSFVFVSDGSFQQRLKTEVILKAGERKALKIMDEEEFQAPFSLSRKSQVGEQQLSKSHIIDVLDRFSTELKKEEAIYQKVWDSHLQFLNDGDHSNKNGQESAIYFFGQKMAQIIEEDLGLKLEDLDFDKDPHQMVGQIVSSLQNFDLVSKRKTLNVIRPKLESWLQNKLVSIRELVAKTMSFENWLPASENVNFSESVVNVFYVLNENLENLYEFLGKEIFLRWSKQGKKAGTFAISKKSNQVEYTPAMFNQLAGMGNKNFAASNDQSISLQKLLVRLANIDYIHERIEDLRVRFFSLSHPEVSLETETQNFKNAVEILHESAKVRTFLLVIHQSIVMYIAYKMVYIDFNDVIFYNLYIGKGQEKLYIKRLLQDTSKKLSNVSTQLQLIGREVGLNRLECEQACEVVYRFLQYMREDDQMMIGLFKSIDTDVQRNKEMISRVLYRRQTKDVDKFFDDYKTLFGK